MRGLAALLLAIFTTFLWAGPGQAQASSSFSPTAITSLSVSGSSSRVAFPDSNPTALIINTGANTAYLKFGGSTVTATTSGYYLGAGCSVAYSVTGQPYVAAITATSTTTLSIITGGGVPTLSPSSCALSGGGGGAVSTTITAPLGNQTKAASVAVVGATASTVAPAVVTLSTTAGQVLATGTGFVSRTVCNDDTAITEYFGPASVTNAGANGVKLQPGQCWSFDHNTAAIFGVSASATPNARVVQY